jgi:hypothetical protein
VEGSQSVTSSSFRHNILNKPPDTLIAPSVSTNLEAAYDGLGGHSKIDTFPVPSPKFKLPPQKKLKYSGTSKPKKKITVSYK